MRPGYGTLFGIGVGPGDPELITLKALHVIRKIPFIAVPVAEPEQKSQALETIGQYLPENTRILKLHFAMIKDEAIRARHRKQAADKIAAVLKEGHDVAFLTEGDVMTYSTFAYMLKLLGDQFNIKLIPGISSIMASACEAQLPLVINHQRMIVLPATHENLNDLGQYFNRVDTIIMLKIQNVIENIRPILEKNNMMDRAWIIENASRSESRIHTDISNIKNGQLPYMSQLIISLNIKERIR